MTRANSEGAPPAELKERADAALDGIVKALARQAAREHMAKAQALAGTERLRKQKGRSNRDGDEDESVYVTLDLAARLTGIEEGRMVALIAVGKIGAVAAGDMMLLPISSLRGYLASHRSGECER